MGLGDAHVLAYLFLAAGLLCTGWVPLKLPSLAAMEGDSERSDKALS